MYERVNRNSFAQFMRTRIRYLHVSKRVLFGVGLDGNPITRLGPGVTFKREAGVEKRRHGGGRFRRENLARLRKLRK